MPKQRVVRVSRRKKKKPVPVTHETLQTLVAEETDYLRERIEVLEVNSQVLTVILQDMRTSLNTYIYNAGDVQDELYSLIGNMAVSLNNIEKLYALDVVDGAERVPSILVLDDYLDLSAAHDAERVDDEIEAFAEAELESRAATRAMFTRRNS